MPELNLTRGKFARIDECDYDEISRDKWQATQNNLGKKIWYATRGVHISGSEKNRRTKTEYMHIRIMNPGKGQVVDHINGDGLDNRRENLRVCKRLNNSQNQRKRLNTSSKYKGVYWDKNRGKWQARVTFKGKSIFLGRFESEYDAAKAYDLTAVKIFGQFSNTNFKARTEL